MGTGRLKGLQAVSARLSGQDSARIKNVRAVRTGNSEGYILQFFGRILEQAAVLTH